MKLPFSPVAYVRSHLFADKRSFWDEAGSEVLHGAAQLLRGDVAQPQARHPRLREEVQQQVQRDAGRHRRRQGRVTELR